MNQDNVKLIVNIISKRQVFDAEFYQNSHGLIGYNYDQLIEHYVIYGDKNNFQPNVLFDPVYYRTNNQLKFRGLGNTLVDYLLIGTRYGAAPCPGFDAEFIAQEYRIEPRDALKYYVSQQVSGKYIKPNLYFDPEFYLLHNSDIKAARIDPYYHFINWGANEGRLPQQGFGWSKLISNLGDFASNRDAFISLIDLPKSCASVLNKTKSTGKLLSEIKAIHRTDRYEPLRKPPHAESKIPVDVFAFYLTQFHRIPENDAWWGPGFTEWNNVVRGLPRFHGHYQPRVPADLGFYDLTNLETIRKQVELARAGGLTGFGFYYYNFGGKRLLERPLNLFLENKDLDIKFFYIWANETWSKRWDGSENEILIEQKYPDSIIKELVNDATQAFLDDRYYRVNNRPLYVIYRPSAIPATIDFIAKLRAEFAQAGQNPWIYMAQSFNDNDPGIYNLDGAMEFPPHKYTTTTPTYHPKTLYTDSTALRVYEYDDIVDFAREVKGEGYPLVRACFPSWDNDARKQGDSVVINGSTPEKFKEWLDVIITETQSRPDDPQVICINAWNEWGEGAYLEPDRHFGHAYLNALQSVLHNQHTYQYRKMLLVGHDAFPSGAQRLLLRIGETLQKYFATDVTFLLLRGDRGYDGLLNAYRAVANTIVADLNEDSDLPAKLNALQREGYRHALINTAVASKLTPKLGKGWKTIQLIHELEGMLHASDTDGTLKENLLAADKIIAPTAGIYRLLESKYQIPQSKLLKRPQGLYRNINPVDKGENLVFWQNKLGVKKLPKVVTGLGYADRRKGTDIFVNVCKHLSDAGADVCFIWQGDWDPVLKSELNHIIQDLTERKKLLLMPLNENVESLLDISDTFFLSSREDPLPTVAFEAWAFGKPVVAIDGTGGIADLIAENPDLGSLTAYPPTVADCATVIKNSVQNDQKRTLHQTRINWVKTYCGWCDYVFDLRQFLFSDPVIDVRIVAHNHGQFVEKRVDSLLNQTQPARSIQYVDIGSNEKTKEIVAGKLDVMIDRVKLRFEETNNGKLYKTWLKLAKESDAEFLHIAEGDDAVTPEYLERLSKVLREYPEAGFAFSAVKWVDEVGKKINDQLAEYVTKTINLDRYEDGFINSNYLLESGLLVANPILSVSSVLWRRKILIEALVFGEKYFDKISFAFDWLLYICCAVKNNGFYFDKTALVEHTQHEGSMSCVNIGAHIDEIVKCHKLINDISESNHLIHEKQAAYIKSLG